MTRPADPVPVTCVEALTGLADSCAASGYRGLAVIAGPTEWCESLHARLNAARPAEELVVDGSRSGRHLLGRECDRVVFDATRGLDPDTLGIVGGTLRAGGLLVLLTPPLDVWPEQPDPVLDRWTPYPFRYTDTRARFISRLIARFEDAVGAAILTPDGVRRRVPLPKAPAERALPDGATASPDQARAVTAVVSAAEGRAHRPLVLEADRGRGKSTALGIAAARLLRGRPERRIIVTAPRRDATEALFRALRQDGETGNLVRFLAPDELLRSDPPSDLLLVDEAAGLPAALLEALLRRHRRIVFATTTHGYEGAGQGFAIRFADTLDRLTPSWRRIELQTPIRWPRGDPLERWLSRALLLDAEPQPMALSGAIEPVVNSLDRDALAADEPLLRAVFGLLVEAHYQTRPSDLRQMLDAPGVAVWTATLDGSIAGVAVTDDEGPLPPELLQPIELGRRRLRGNLLPQSLVTHAGVPEAGRLRCRRIVRIAVDARCRRRGIGAIMLNEIGCHSVEDGMDTTGASFGATAGLLNFWCQCGYRPVRLGMRRDTASGTHSVMLLAPITDTARQVAERLRPIAARHLHYHLPRRLAGLEPAVTVALLGALPCPPAPGADDWREVWAMAHGNRGIADAAPGLAVVLEHALGMGTAARLPAPRLQLLVHIILQGVEPAAAAPRFGLSGRRAVEAELRDGARTMLRIMGPERLQPSTE